MLRVNNHQPCPACGRYLNRGLTVDVAIFRCSRLLLIKRGVDPGKGLWALPGGHVEWDQTVEDAVRQEVKDETGLTVTGMNLVAVFSRPDRAPRQKIALAYVAAAEGEPRPGDDASEAVFFPLEKLPDKIAFDHRRIIGVCRKKTGC